MFHPTDKELREVENWFTYHSPSKQDQEAYETIRTQARKFAMDLLVLCPPSADRTAALRKLRECVMTANASIACRHMEVDPKP